MYKNTSEVSNDTHTAKSTLISRNITISGRRTSVRLEPEMWMGLKEISKRENCTIHDICSLIGLRKNENTSLTAAIRVFLMLCFRASSTEDGHQRAGHGSFTAMKERAKLSVKPEMRRMLGKGNQPKDFDQTSETSHAATL